LFVCLINDLAQIKVSFTGNYTATRPYSTSVDLSAPNSVSKHSYAAVKMFADVIRDDIWSIRAYLPLNILKHAYVRRLWHTQFEHSSLKKTIRARITNTMQHIRREGSPRFKSACKLVALCVISGFCPKVDELPLSGLLCSEWW
jgi:hypothetical protein